jgi:type III secretion protein C
LIEIQAMVVDVNTDRMEQLGVNWGGRSGRGAVGFRNPTAATDTSSRALTLNWAAAKNAVNPTTLLVDSGNYLVAQIQALESRGDAHVHSQPSVLTLENLGAVFDDSRTFYVRIQGERVASVTPVTAGTTLRVTPRVVDSDGKRQLALVIDITDGKIEPNGTVDSLPIVQRSQISTEALVGDSETLVIGGYTNEQDIRQNDRVPVLGAIPVLGALFTSSSVERQKRERMFLIRPRIVSMTAGAASASPPLATTPDSPTGAPMATVPDGPGGQPRPE